MALADRRPLDFPVASTPTSPAFNPRTLNRSGGLVSRNADKHVIAEEYNEDDDEDLNDDGMSADELSPTSRSISPDSLMNSDLSLGKSNTQSAVAPSTSNSSRGSTPPSVGLQKKPKTSSRVPIATGISTTIPVTGEKPRPSQKDDPSLEDDVLFAIFLILYEKDPEGKGMTVKQICDILIDRHPEMANLSTKTSNLVSAKLNAYVKRVEKGDSSLKYALSRDWADASPKRMVYVYRGLLTDDFHVHVKTMMETQKGPEVKHHKQHLQTQSKLADEADNDSDSSSFDSGKQSGITRQRRSTMFDLGVNKNSFLSNSIDKSNLFVPYSSAPVTASLKDKIHTAGAGDDSQSQDGPKKLNHESDLELDEFEVFNDNNNDHDIIETVRKGGKRSKSMSYLSNKKNKILTAAAAAPRAPRTPCSHSPNAAAAAAALHAAALKAISNSTSELTLSSEDSENVKDVKTTICGNKNWLSVIRSGFLTQDIGTPEDLSLADLDKFFS